MSHHAIAVAVLGLLSAGCASLYEGRVEAARKAFEPTRREEIWIAAMDELDRRGFAIAVRDPEQGLIRTEHSVRPGRLPCGLVTCRFRDTVEVVVAPDASLVVRVKREVSSLMVQPGITTFFVDEAWTPPSRWQREVLAAVEEEQRDLLRAITE